MTQYKRTCFLAMLYNFTKLLYSNMIAMTKIKSQSKLLGHMHNAIKDSKFSFVTLCSYEFIVSKTNQVVESKVSVTEMPNIHILTKLDNLIGNKSNIMDIIQYAVKILKKILIEPIRANFVK